MPLYSTCGFFGFGKKTSCSSACPSTERMYNIVAVDKTYSEAKQLITPGCSMLSHEDVMQNHEKLSTFVSGLSGSSWVNAGRTPDDTFKWIDGTPMKMGAEGHWAPGEPNNSQGKETLVQLRTDGQMNDCKNDVKNIVVESCPVRRG